MATEDNKHRLSAARAALAEARLGGSSTPYAAVHLPDGNCAGGTLPFPAFFTEESSVAHGEDPELFEDDVFIVSFPKAGTTWMSQIVQLLRTAGEQGDDVLSEAIPWYDKGPVDFFDRMQRPRCFHSHLQVQLFPKSIRKRRVIYVMRNPKDSVVSFYHHDRSKNEYDSTLDEYVKLFLEGNVHFGSWFDHVSGWHRYDEAHPAEMLWVTYEDMSETLERVVRSVASYLNLQASDELIKTVCLQSSFQSMKENAKANGEWIPQRANATPHLRQGEVGNWQEHLTDAQSAKIDAVTTERLGDTRLEIKYTLNP